MVNAYTATAGLAMTPPFISFQETLGPAQATGGHYYLSVNLTDVTFKDVYISHVIAG